MLAFTYTDQVPPDHMLEVPSQPKVVDGVKARATRRLTGHRMVSYYGCVLVRLPEITGWGSPEYPMRMDRLVEAIGAEPVDWSYNVDRCRESLDLSRSDMVVTLSVRLAEAARDARADAIAVLASCATSTCAPVRN